MSCFQQVLLTSKDNCQWNSTLVVLIRPVSVCSGKYQHWDLTVLFFFSSSRYKFQGQHIHAVSILNDAFQHHQNTLKRKMRCICRWALVVLLRQGNLESLLGTEAHMSQHQSLSNQHPALDALAHPALRSHSGFLTPFSALDIPCGLFWRVF